MLLGTTELKERSLFSIPTYYLADRMTIFTEWLQLSLKFLFEIRKKEVKKNITHNGMILSIDSKKIFILVLYQQTNIIPLV